MSLDARDLRSGGTWSRSQRLKNAAIYRLVRLLLAIADRVPQAVLLALGRALGAAAHHLLPAARRRAEENLRRALAVAGAQVLARRCFVRAGENLAICLLLRRQKVRALDLIDVSDGALACIDRALARGRGAVFVSAHLGPFEALAAAVAELGRPATVVVRESYDPRLDPIVDRHRVERGLGVIHRGAPGAATKIVRALKQNRLVGFLPDLGGRVPSQHVRFLGSERKFALGPQRIARRAGAPLLIGVLSAAAPGRSQLRLEVQELSSNQDDAEMTQCVADALSAAIVALPEHWLWMVGAGAPTTNETATP